MRITLTIRFQSWWSLRRWNARCPGQRHTRRQWHHAVSEKCNGRTSWSHPFFKHFFGYNFKIKIRFIHLTFWADKIWEKRTNFHFSVLQQIAVNTGKHGEKVSEAIMVKSPELTAFKTDCDLFCSYVIEKYIISPRFWARSPICIAGRAFNRKTGSIMCLFRFKARALRFAVSKQLFYGFNKRII